MTPQTTRGDHCLPLCYSTANFSFIQAEQLVFLTISLAKSNRGANNWMEKLFCDLSRNFTWGIILKGFRRRSAEYIFAGLCSAEYWKGRVLYGNLQDLQKDELLLKHDLYSWIAYFQNSWTSKERANWFIKCSNLSHVSKLLRSSLKLHLN